RSPRRPGGPRPPRRLPARSRRITPYVKGFGRAPRAGAGRLFVALVSLFLFFAAQTAAVAHTHALETDGCVSCSHAHGPAHDLLGADPAAPRGSAPDACALCRVLGAVPVPLALPAPLPLPEVAHEPAPPRAVEPTPAPVVRDSLARGPPSLVVT